MIKDSKIASIAESISIEKQKLLSKINSAPKRKKVSKVIKVTSQRYADILELETEIKGAMKLLNESLEGQREFSSAAIGLKTIEEQTNISRKLPSKRFNYIQELFSLKSDYRELSDKDLSIEEEDKLIPYIIIQPEFISDELLIALGLEDESFSSLTYSEQLKRKIAHINTVKSFFTNTLPLNIGGGWSDYTSRIMLAKKSKLRAYGKLLLIQNMENGDEKGRDYKKTLTIHDDIYTLFRSQQHTSESLVNKEKILGKTLTDLRDSRFQIGKKPLLENIANAVKSLKGFKGFHIKNAVALLEKINGENSNEDSINLEKAISRLDKKLKEIISQKTSIYKHSENLGGIINNLEEDWKSFFKKFKLILKKFSTDKIDDIVEMYSNLNSDFKSDTFHTIRQKADDIESILIMSEDLDYDHAAKIQAYLWAEEDMKNGRDTSTRIYQEHQYFEALKQKKEFYHDLRITKKGELQFIQNAEKLLGELTKYKYIDTLLETIETYLKSRPEFCANPFSKIYDRIGQEFVRIKSFKSNEDIIGIIRSILTINLLLKEQGFLIFMSKIEGNIDVGKLEKSDNFREYLLRSIDKNLKYMEEKDFLKKQSYPQESKVNKRFQEYIGILKQLQQIIKSGEYTKLSDTLQGIRKGFY